MRNFAVFILCLFSSALSAQTMWFDIKVFGSNVGRMSVTRIKEPDGTDLYKIESNSKAKVLWITKTYQSKFEARYKNGKLVSCSHIENENGKPKRWANVVFDGKLYQVDSDKGKRSFTEAPQYCDMSLYFEDHKKINKVFYLADADFNTISHIDANTLEFKSSDGHRNVYFYENGIIKKMEFHLALATVFMTRVN